jgi:hypothetical protein
MGESRDGDITDVFATFDVDFSLGSVSNGFLRVCVAGSSGCVDADSWEVSFTGSVNSGYLSTSLATGDIYYDNGDTDYFYDGNIDGIFTDLNTTDYSNNRFDAFAGGFNLEAATDDNYVSGVFLTERDDRFDNDFDGGGSSIIQDIMTSEHNGIILSADDQLITGLNGQEIGIWAGNETVFMDDSGNVYNLGDGSCDYYCDFHNGGGGYVVQVGLVYDFNTDVDSNNPDYPVFKFDDNLEISIGSAGTTILTNPVAFVNYHPADPFTQQTGRFSSSNSTHTDDYGFYFEGAPGNGTVKYYGFEGNKIDIVFDADFSSGFGAINNGKMKLQVKDLAESRLLNYEITFNATVNADSEVTLTPVTTSYFETDFSNNLIAGTESTIDGVTISGGLAGDSNQPIFTGVVGFTEQRTIGGSPVDSFVEGFFITDGYVEDRLTDTQLKAMETYIGMSYNATQGNYKLASASSTTLVPLLGDTFHYTGADWGDSEATRNEILSSRINTVVKENGTGSTVNSVAGFDVGWGVWANGRDVAYSGVTDVFAQESTTPDYWLSAKPIDKDLMPVTGSIVYNDVLGYQGGSTNDGAFKALTAWMNVNFGTGGLNGNIMATTTDSDIVWDVNVAGNINGYVNGVSNGSTAALSATSLTVGGSSIPSFGGDMTGIFVGTSSPNAFATGFNIQDFTNGNRMAGTALIGIGPQP